ncbi:MAG: ABC transporter ATP-binding protein [Flavipsychrobacter sp.]|nr:ABC transporter ATP-binding protein [Flavipsychrobacter sp.]
MNSDTVLAVSNLSITFGGEREFVAVRELTFGVGKGKTLAIVGESGSGKSLTALSLMGLLPPGAAVKGDIILHTHDKALTLTALKTNSDWQPVRGAKAGMVFQEPMSSLNPVMRIGKQLAECIRAHQQVSGDEAKKLALHWLQQVQLPQPEKLYERYPHELSGGQKQRVMIAMAMCNHPVLLIADEPTTALDVTVQQEVVRLMQYLQQQHNTALIFITHDLALAATIADDVLVMYKGEAVEYGTAAEVLRSPKHPYTQALVACKPSPEQKGLKLPTVSDFLDADRSKAAAGVSAPVTTTVGVDAEHILEVSNLKVWFAEEKNWLGKPTSYFKAVDGVSFHLRKGEVLGLVGESGCGKSTVSRALIGLLPVHEGEIRYNGENLAALPHKEWPRIRRDIQMIFQDPFASLNPRMTVGDMLMESMRVHRIVADSGLKTEACRLLDIVHLPADALKRYPHQFSGGQRQRIGIARALALKPKLIICDESVSALDVSVQAQILNLLKELQHEFQLSYLFISHDLSVVHYISDRVMVMQSGKIVECGEAEQVLKRPENAYTRRLVAAIPEMK